MRKTLTFLLIALCFTAAAQNSSTSAPQSQIYITHVSVIDTETGKEATDQTVVISDGKVADVAKSKNLAAPTSARIVDGKGKYLIPGLWDMHVHTWDYESTYPLYIANGVTGVRDMFGPPDANKFRSELAAKKLAAPHFYLASPIIDGHPKVWPTSIEVNTPEEARKVVDEQKQRGADFIKVYSRLSRETYFAIVEESGRQQIPFEGHVPSLISAWEASNAKQRSFEHLLGISLACSSREEELRSRVVATAASRERSQLAAEGARSYSEGKCQRLFSEFKKNGTWQVPTLTVNRSPGMLNDPQFRNDDRLRYFGGDYRNWLVAKDDFRLKGWTAEDFALHRELFAYDQKLVDAMFRAGVPMLAGTDAGNPFCFPGFSLHDELALLVESGLTPLAALQAATRNAAIFMDGTDRYGSVEKGKIADLVLLDADPLQDIHNTTKISEVFLDGREYDRAALDLILQNAEQEAKAQLANLVTSSRQIDPEFRGFWTLNVAKSDFGERPKPKSGFVNWGEHGWTFAIVQADGHVYADAVETSHGCEFIGLAPNDLSCTVEVVTPRHVRLTVKQGATIRRIGDIELLEEGTTKTTHRVTPQEGATYVEKTIWEKPGREQSKSSPGPSAEAELRTFMAELRKASIEGDMETAANSMTDDYVQTDINGYRQDKTTWLNEYFRPLADLIKAGKFHWDEYDRKNLQFRFYVDCAIVTGELHAKGTGAKLGPQHTWVADPNATFSGTLHFTHVYIKQNGKWMLAALHNQMPLRPANAAK